MQYLLPLLLIALIIQTSVAPPVNKQADEKDKENEVDDSEDVANIMEYHRYLKEVIQALESDADFRQKLEKADEADIRTGKIAHELEFVDHKIRSKLDELKREELERLRHLATKEHNLMNGLDLDHLKIAEHMDHSNTHTFEIDDLKKLIAKTTKDLAEADKRRREEFKQYEMEKKFEEEQKIKGNTGMKEEERNKYEAELEAMKKKHKDHQPLHHPGSKQQLEEVWEKQDHMENQEFDPKTFFHFHDLDGNGFWDQDEVKALFLKELDKLYSQGAPEDDIYERHEEMERMREHVFNEADLNHDGLISFEEFLEQTKKPNFQQDEGWQGLDEQQIYSQQEYEAYEKRRQEEVQKMIAKGMLPPSPDNAHLPVQHEQFPPHQYQNSMHQQQFEPQQYHPQQGYPSQQQYPGQMAPQQGHYQGQVPQQIYYQGQLPQQQQQQQYQAHPSQNQAQVPHQQNFQDKQIQQQYQAQPQQVQYQGQQVQDQMQHQLLQHQAQQQAPQGQPQHTQQQMQNQVPQNTQDNVSSSSQRIAQSDHNSPQQQNSGQQQQQQPQQSNPNSIPKAQKV